MAKLIGRGRSTKNEERNNESKLNYFSGITLQILKWVSIFVFAIMFIVTVVVITINVIDTASGSSQTRIPDSKDYLAQPPILEWYSNIGEIRGTTIDDIRKTFIIEPHIGYEQNDRAVQAELIARDIQLRELINFYFSSRIGDELDGVENRQKVKADLTREINRIMRSGKIRDVAFNRYQIVDF